MKLIIGLGNPGEKYENSRHNVGWLVLDQLVKEWRMGFKLDKKTATLRTLKKTESTEIILAKPLTFMNKSGEAVRFLITNYKLLITDLYIIHDDLDIPLGKYKIQLGKGPRKHGGVESVEKTLGTKDFWRVRVGIENRKEKLRNSVAPPDTGPYLAPLPEIKKLREKRTKRISGEEYVLAEFTQEEKQVIDGVILEVVEEIKKRLCSGNSKL